MCRLKVINGEKLNENKVKTRNVSGPYPILATSFRNGSVFTCSGAVMKQKSENGNVLCLAISAQLNRNLLLGMILL